MKKTAAVIAKSAVFGCVYAGTTYLMDIHLSMMQSIVLLFVVLVTSEAVDVVFD